MPGPVPRAPLDRTAGGSGQYISSFRADDSGRPARLDAITIETRNCLPMTSSEAEAANDSVRGTIPLRGLARCPTTWAGSARSAAGSCPKR